MFDIRNMANGGKTWLTADLHFSHQLMVSDGQGGRPWKNVDRHNNTLIRNACDLVKPEDLFIIDGDLTLYGSDMFEHVAKLVARLPGRKVLVFGNHDRFKPLRYVDMGFLIATTALVLRESVLVVHDPARSEMWPRDCVVLCGHVHDFFKQCRNVVNVGVDVWDYKPVLLEEAVALADLGSKEEVNWRQVSRERHRDYR